MRRLLVIGALGLVLLIAVVLGRTVLLGAAPLPTATAPVAAVDAAGNATKLAGALRLPTVSHLDPTHDDRDAFAALHDYLARAFPGAHAALGRERVDPSSLLYTWRGSQPDLKPVLLAAHLDVVPVEPETEASWRHPPFAGDIADGFIWGRGALDDKAAVVGLLAAVEHLKAEGFRPRRTLYLAFGADEEVGGRQGAAALAALLRERGVRLDFVLDEGGAVTQGIVPGIGTPAALVGIAEKGYLDVELVAHTAGGHSSMPSGGSAIDILAAALHRLEQRPLPARLKRPMREMFAHLGPHMPFAQRLVFANLWLFEPLVIRQLLGAPVTQAAVRTTSGSTLIAGGVKTNVLPTTARAVVNFRLLPGDSVAGVLEHVRRTVVDPRVTVKAAPLSFDPSPVSDAQSNSFALLAYTIAQTFPDAAVAPYLTVGSTDSRHYAALADNVYRFLPIRLHAADVQRIHGIDERIAVQDFARVVQFYIKLMRKL